MDITWLLNLWFSNSLVQLLAPTIQRIGFQNPLTLIVITTYNTLSITTLFMLTVIAYPILNKKTWTLPLTIAATWTLITILFILNYQQKHGLITATATILPHAWLEFTAIYLWITKLKKACIQNQPPQINNTPTLKTWLKTLKNPKRTLQLLKTDAEKTWKTTKISFKTLWNPTLKKDYTFIIMLIFISATLETYLTPTITALTTTI
jgi:hypothetical protein